MDEYLYMKNKNIDWEDELEAEERSSDNRGVQRFIGRILANWYWFVLCGLIGFSVAFLRVRYTVPTYKIQAKLLVSDDKKGSGASAADALGELSGLMGTKSSVDNEVEVLKTRDLIHEVVLVEKAYITFSKMGTVHAVPVSELPYTITLLTNPDSIEAHFVCNIEPINDSTAELVINGSKLSITFGRDFRIPGIGTLNIMNQGNLEEGYGFTIVPPKRKASELLQALSVSVTNKSVSTIDLVLDHQLPKIGEKLLNSLIARHVERNLNDKNVVADSTLSFINARLVKITDELAGVEDNISGYKQRTQLADISEQSRILLETSAENTKSLAASQTQLDILDAVGTYLKDEDNPRVVPSSVIPNDMVFNNLVERYNELVLQRERLLLANTENNPLVENVTGQIKNLREDMINNVANTRRQLHYSKQSQVQLSNRISAQIERVPTIERGYIDLARLQQIKQEQYIFLQQKWEETAISRTANVSNSKVIDSPKADENPFLPQKGLIYVIGLALGLLLPLLLIYIQQLLNVKIQSVDDIDTYSNLPILGLIAHSAEEDQVVVTKTSRSAIAEQFRALRTNLDFALQGGKTVLFTSSMAGEGKSFVALNIAVSLALLDKKVLLMELDLRKPSVTSKLGLAAGKGFSHFVVKPEMKWEEIIMKSGAHELVDLIQAGAIPPNPAELLVHPRTANLMNELKEKYDYILIDAPPVGMVTDAQLLAKYADACLYLVRQGRTYKEQLRIPNDLQAKGKIKPIHLIVNDVKISSGYYSNYGYGYGYGDYAQEQKAVGWWKFWAK